MVEGGERGCWVKCLSLFPEDMVVLCVVFYV